MLEVSGFPMPLGSNVRIRSADNDYVYGEVVGFRGHRSLVLPFDTNKPLVTGAPVEPHGASSMVPVGKTLLGRTMEATGNPHDGRRSEERRVGKECVSKCRSRGSPSHEKKKTKT